MSHNTEVVTSTVRGRTARPTFRFQAVCSCGWRSNVTHVAGMAHGADIAHREAHNAAPAQIGAAR